MLPDDPRHGSERGHEQHLRDGEPPCAACIDADHRASRRRHKRRAMGHRYTIKLGERNHHKLVTTKAKGASWDQLAGWIGVSPSVTWRMINNGPHGIVYARTWIRVREFTPGRIVTPVGVTRRIRALCALGYSPQRIANEAGVHLDTVRDARTEPREFLSARVAESIADAYERLCMGDPLAGGSSRGVGRVRNHARRNGWAPPLAWDDIDDPNETPNTGTPDGATRGPGTRRRDQIIEDVEWMADADETLTTVCNRLNMTPETLYATCRRTGRYDLYARLSDREPLGHLARDMRAIKRGAA